MKSKSIFLTGLVSATVLSVGIFYEMYANSNGASSQTTAAGEVTCSQSGCHGSGNGEASLGGIPDNTGGGSITISGITGSYTPGAVYHVTVTVNQTGAGKFGFNCEALDISNGNAGTFSITQTGTWIRQGVNGTRNTVSQGHTGSTGSIAGAGNDTFDFTFDWTAPSSSVGPITFYASGLASNQNNLNDAGDQVYYKTLTLSPSISPSSQILISRSSFNFPSFYSLASSVGNMQELWVGGQALTGNLAVNVTPGSQFKIATSASGPWVSSIPLTATSGSVSGTGIYVQYTGLATGTQTDNLVVSGGGASSKTIALSGVVRTGATVPTISTASPSNINFGSIPVGGGATAPQTFTVSWANPVSGLTVTCSPGFEISTSPGYDYSNMLTPNFVGIGFTITGYVRAKNPQTAGALNGNIVVSLAGATSQTITLGATATMPSQLVLASVDNLNLFVTNPGTPTATQTLSVNGTGLASTLDVTSTTNFEVSLAPTSGFGSSVSITPTAGNVSATTVYVRYNPTAAGLDAGYVTASSVGAANQDVNVYGDCFGSGSSGISNAVKTEVVMLYPNPTSGLLKIKNNTQLAEVLVTVMDMSGRMVFNDKINPSSDLVDISNHAEGVYFVVISNTNKSILSTQKVILKK